MLMLCSVKVMAQAAAGVTMHNFRLCPLDVFQLSPLCVFHSIVSTLALSLSQLFQWSSLSLKQGADMERNVRLTDVMGDAWLASLASISASLAALGMQQLMEEAALGVACAHVQQVLGWRPI